MATPGLCMGRATITQRPATLRQVIPNQGLTGCEYTESFGPGTLTTLLAESSIDLFDQTLWSLRACWPLKIAGEGHGPPPATALSHRPYHPSTPRLSIR